MNRKPRLAAGLICGNEEERIERCVKSLQRICDDIVVIRAVGSLKPDRTLDIAKKLGCKIGEYLNSPLTAKWPHLDDFAAARNQSFRIAYELAGKEGWVMWADCDDELEESMAEPHLKVIRECPKEYNWILTDYVIPEQKRRAPRERIFRYHTGWWWRAVHENVHPVADTKVNIQRDLEIVHKPALGKRPSNERNQRILQYQDQFTAHWKFYLHYEKMITGHRPEAIRYGAEAIALKGLDDVHRYETLLNMSNMTDGDAARRFAKKAMELNKDRREAYAIYASILMDDNKPVESLATLEEMEKIPVPEFPQWTHRAEYYGWKAKQLRAWALRLCGKGEEAFKLESEILIAGGTPRISLLHATRGRPLAAAQAMNLWMSRAERSERVEHIFSVDSDDETARMLQRFPGVMQDDPEGYSVGAWNLAAKHSTGDILIQLSDDWEPPPGWDTKIESRLDTQKPQVLRISDGHRKDDLLCMAILTRKYYEAHGLFDPKYKNVYSDNDFTFRAAKAGALVDARDITIVHHHPVFEPVHVDATYKRGNDPAEYERAKAIFEADHGAKPKEKLEGIAHIFAICKADKEPQRADFLHKWLKGDFVDDDYFTIGAYCYGDSLTDGDLEKYCITNDLNLGNKSLALNHIKIFEHILQTYKPGDNFLILESDAVPVDGYQETIRQQMALLQGKEWDYLDVGNGCNLFPQECGHQVDPNECNVFLCKRSRCAHSIIWSYAGIEKFYRFLKNNTLNQNIDWMLNQWINATDANVYWAHPFCIKQGSQCGIYNSVQF